MTNTAHDSDDRSSAMSRRRFIAGGAVAAGAVVVGVAIAGCSDAKTAAPSGSAAPPATPPTAAATAPPVTTTSTAAAATTTVASTTTSAAPVARLSDIEHVVILFQENRSFDHYFGTRQGVAGFASTSSGQAYQNPFAGHPDGYLLPFRYDSAATSAQCGPDPNHSWAAQHAAWNNGKNDGFATSMGAHALGYFTRADIAYYWALADEFTLCDHYFCSVLGPTNPNRHVAMTGTIDPAATGGGPAIDNSGVAYTWETYPERLQRAGVTWRVYHEVDDFDDNNLKFFTQFQGLTAGKPLYDNAMVNLSAGAFAADAAANNLPQVSWLVAPTAISEHPTFAPSVGENFSAAAIAAVMSNPALWAKTAFILSYDENGGFFDHMAPPTPGAGTVDEFVNGAPIGPGFRVPTTVISPWTRRPAGTGTTAAGARVNTTVLDHTSVLRFLETRFGVEAPLISQWRRDTVGNLSDVFDFATFDPSVPKLPDTAARAAELSGGCGDKPAAMPPATQVPAMVEP